MTTTVLKTIRASGGDFTSLSAWEAAIPADLVAVDEQWIAECYNDWPTGLEDSFSAAAHTTDTTRKMVIKAADANGTQGASKNYGDVNSGFKLVHPASNPNYTFAYSGKNVDIDGFVIERSNNGTILDCNNGTGLISSMILKSDSINSISNCIYRISTNITLYKVLTIGGYKGYNIKSYNSPKLYNCNAIGSFISGYFKYSGNGTGHTLKNCIGFNNGSDFSIDAGANDANNASSDLTATGTNAVTGIVIADFLDAANDDYHLSAASQLKGAGLNLITSGDLTSPQYDIDGDQWPDAGAWDIGFDYYVSGAATYNYTGSGGVVIGGVATTSLVPSSVTYNHTSNGGINTSGTATVSTEKDFVASGGISTSGSADTSLVPAGVVYNHIATGGIVTGGSAEIIQIKDYQSSGGITSGGQAVTSLAPAGLNIYNHVSSGGITTGGTAEIIQIKDFFASGGIVITGVADTGLVQAGTNVYNYISTGGISTGGSAEIIQIKDYQASGGFVISGNAITSSSAIINIVIAQSKTFTLRAKEKNINLRQKYKTIKLRA